MIIKKQNNLLTNNLRCSLQNKVFILLQSLYLKDKWKYQFIKDAKNIGLNIQYSQLDKVLNGTSNNLDIVIAAIIIINQKSVNKRFSITIVNNELIIKV